MSYYSEQDIHNRDKVNVELAFSNDVFFKKIEHAASVYI